MRTGERLKQVSVPLRGEGFERIGVGTALVTAVEDVSVPLRGEGFESLLTYSLIVFCYVFQSPCGERALKGSDRKFFPLPKGKFQSPCGERALKVYCLQPYCP